MATTTSQTPIDPTITDTEQKPASEPLNLLGNDAAGSCCGGSCH